jgi:hypothetical protein
MVNNLLPSELFSQCSPAGSHFKTVPSDAEVRRTAEDQYHDVHSSSQIVLTYSLITINSKTKPQ